MKETDIYKYCELIIKAGINLYEGQSLIINTGIKSIGFASMLAETAYKNGAKYVDFVIVSNALSKFRIDSNNENDISYFPNYITSRGHELVSGDYAYVKIDNLEEIDELKGVDAGKFNVVSQSEQNANKPISNAVLGSKITWCIVAAPGPVWASKVFGKNGSTELTDDLWEKMAKILRLDKPDPVQEWKKNGEKLIARSKTLNDMKIDKLIFKGQDTDLEIGLNKTSVWRGGLVQAQNGRTYIPNIPTEEVFTTPDFRRVNGKVKVTKPVKVLENIVRNIHFEFKDGKLINFKGDNIEILEKYFSTDEGARYLGEVALVDKNSEVHKSGLIFNSILYDENAACHIALGRGIPMCFTNRTELITPEAMKKGGCNYSLVHTDFMIGSDEINVTGIDSQGNKIAIIKDGLFEI